MSGSITFNARVGGGAAPGEARGPLGGREPYSAERGRQSDSRAVRWAAPEEARGPLGGREPYSAEGGRP
jgi:hypothetical protein